MKKKNLSKREATDKLMKEAGFVYVQKTGAMLMHFPKKPTKKKENPDEKKTTENPTGDDKGQEALLK